MACMPSGGIPRARETDRGIAGVRLEKAARRAPRRSEDNDTKKVPTLDGKHANSALSGAAAST